MRHGMAQAHTAPHEAGPSPDPARADDDGGAPHRIPPVNMLMWAHPAWNAAGHATRHPTTFAAFMHALVETVPCAMCKEHATAYVAETPPPAAGDATRETCARWLHTFHNTVRKRNAQRPLPGDGVWWAANDAEDALGLYIVTLSVGMGGVLHVDAGTLRTLLLASAGVDEDAQPASPLATALPRIPDLGPASTIAILQWMRQHGRGELALAALPAQLHPTDIVRLYAAHAAHTVPHVVNDAALVPNAKGSAVFARKPILIGGLVMAVCAAVIASVMAYRAGARSMALAVAGAPEPARGPPPPRPPPRRR